MALSERHLLVDIDMLFDVRYAELSHFAPEAGVVLLHEGKYFDRERDSVLYSTAKVDDKTWWGTYKDRFISLLKDSPITFLMHNIYPLTNDYLEDNHPGQSVVKKLTINIPYGRLDDESYYELKEALSEHFMGYFESINILHMPHEKLDLQYISKYYSDYFCYRWYDWMKLHYETLDKGLRPSFRMWWPRMLSDVEFEATDRRAKEFIKQTDVYEFFLYLHLPAFEIHWLDRFQTCFYVESEQQQKQEASE